MPPYPQGVRKQGWLHPYKYDPRMERIGYRFPPASGFMPAERFTDLHRVGKAIPTIVYPFLVSRRGGRIATANSTASDAATKRKTPNGFGGLDPWRWAILESVRAPHGKHLPIPKPHKPTKNIGGWFMLCAFPTIATSSALPILPEDFRKCQPPHKKAPKHREIP